MTGSKKWVKRLNCSNLGLPDTAKKKQAQWLVIGQPVQCRKQAAEKKVKTYNLYVQLVSTYIYSSSF